MTLEVEVFGICRRCCHYAINSCGVERTHKAGVVVEAMVHKVKFLGLAIVSAGVEHTPQLGRRGLAVERVTVVTVGIVKCHHRTGPCSAGVVLVTVCLIPDPGVDSTPVGRSVIIINHIVAICRRGGVVGIVRVHGIRIYRSGRRCHRTCAHLADVGESIGNLVDVILFVRGRFVGTIGIEHIVNHSRVKRYTVNT